MDANKLRSAVGILLAALPLAAHHSTRAAFDDRRVVTMSGEVREVNWMNPHAMLLIAVADPAGNSTEWRIDLPPPNPLVREGWKKGDVKAGDRVTIGLWLARDGSRSAHMVSITLPDGRALAGINTW